jgi:riboflavin synthase
MFTGIIEAVGKIIAVSRKGDDMRLTVDTGNLDMHDIVLGDSIAVNGVCLTVVDIGTERFIADVSAETLAHTTLGAFSGNQSVNLEKALTANSRLGGHIVSGHVDGVGEIVEIKTDGRSQRFHIKAPGALSRYIARKGSICVDGISLTINNISGQVFDLNIVPHTLQNTIMNGYQTGTRVNLEVDVIARYLEQLLLGNTSQDTAGITLESLREHGFLNKRS